MAALKPCSFILSKCAFFRVFFAHPLTLYRLPLIPFHSISLLTLHTFRIASFWSYRHQCRRQYAQLLAQVLSFNAQFWNVARERACVHVIRATFSANSRRRFQICTFGVDAVCCCYIVIVSTISVHFRSAWLSSAQMFHSTPKNE